MIKAALQDEQDVRDRRSALCRIPSAHLANRPTYTLAVAEHADGQARTVLLVQSHGAARRKSGHNDKCGLPVGRVRPGDSVHVGTAAVVLDMKMGTRSTRRRMSDQMRTVAKLPFSAAVSTKTYVDRPIL